MRLFAAYAPHTNPLEPYFERKVVVEGRVADDIDAREVAVRATVALSIVDGEDAQGTIIASLPLDTKLQYGDRVVLRGVLKEPESFETENGRTFDYPGYLAARGVSALMPYATLLESQEGGWSVLHTLFALKHSFEQALERVLPASASALMEGFLLGEKHGLSQELMQAFVLVGLVHVVVLSGYNIGVVAQWTLSLFGLVLPRRAALGATAVAVVLFALMAGGGMATLRAMLMGLIALLAQGLHRPAQALRSLGLAALAMLLWNPLTVYDPGFVLSIVATFGLITLAPAAERLLWWLPGQKVRETAATTLAVQVFVLPALLYYTGVLSFAALPMNILVLPFIPLAMFLGFLAGVLALVTPALALLPATLASGLLSIMLKLVQDVAALSYAATTLAVFPFWIAALCYAPLSFVALRLYGRSRGSSRALNHTSDTGRAAWR